MDGLFTDLFGPDFCQYEYTKTKNCILVPGQFSVMDYKHDEWEKDIDEAATRNTEVSSPEAANGSVAVAQSAEQNKPEQQTCMQQRNNSDAPVQQKTESLRNNSGPIVVHSECQWKLDGLNNLTRGERAALPIPKVASIPPQDVVLVQNMDEIMEMNPLTVQSRPPETTVLQALQLTREATCSKSDKNCDELTSLHVKIGSLGTFSSESVRVFEKMCTLAEEAKSMQKEKAWLSTTKKNHPDMSTVKDVLWNSRPNEEVLKVGKSIMDVSDLPVNVMSMDLRLTQFPLNFLRTRQQIC